MGEDGNLGKEGDLSMSAGWGWGGMEGIAAGVSVLNPGPKSITIGVPDDDSMNLID